MQTGRTSHPPFSRSLSTAVDSSTISAMSCLTTLNYKERAPLEPLVVSCGCVLLSNGSPRLLLGSAGSLMVCWSVRETLLQKSLSLALPFLSSTLQPQQREVCIYTKSWLLMHVRQNGRACLPLPAFMSDTCKEGIYPPCSKHASAPSSRMHTASAIS